MYPTLKYYLYIESIDGGLITMLVGHLCHLSGLNVVT